MTAPCGDCPERGCGAKHDTCVKYQAFVEQCKRERERRKEECEVVNNHYDRIRRMIKRRNGRQT